MLYLQQAFELKDGDVHKTFYEFIEDSQRVFIMPQFLEAEDGAEILPYFIEIPLVPR